MSGFAIWVTGLPGSGKSTLAQIMRDKFQAKGIRVEVLESDELRKELFPQSTYSPEERELFYKAMIYLGKALVRSGLNVIFDATANQRKFRDMARSEIDNYMEVYVKCPLGECIRRDPKGLYKAAQEGKTATLPGLQADYEEPLAPEVVVESDKVTAKKGAEAVLSEARAKFGLSI